MVWKRTLIKNDDGQVVEAIAPIIVSASRSTDIPALYSDWFLHRMLNRGHLVWMNPFNRASVYVSFALTRAVIFWTKNAEPLLDHLHLLDERNIGYYFQYTLNDYEREGFEPNLPSLDSRIETFKALSKKIGKEKVIWRFDPLILMDCLSPEVLLERIESIAEAIHAYSRKLAFSFVDINEYTRLKRRLEGTGLREFSESEMIRFAEAIGCIGRRWGLELATCAESIDLSPHGISHNKCVDDRLLLELFPNDRMLAGFLRTSMKKDNGQRPACRCVPSKDIGEYGTCQHLCLYCYATGSPSIVLRNSSRHDADPKGERIGGSPHGINKQHSSGPVTFQTGFQDMRR